jgi:16S rRNA (guanine966-N2)-methyltransferase
LKKREPTIRSEKPKPLRVIGGRYRRRRLKALPGLATRPMLDRQRETLFNVLQSDIEGAIFADLYAGTGAVGIEALSRNASRVLFVESNQAACAVISENLLTVGAAADATVLNKPVSEVLTGLTADIFFLGPPYAAHEEYEQTLTTLGENPPALVIAQHDSKHELAEKYGGLEQVRVLRQGRNCLSLYAPPDDN